MSFHSLWNTVKSVLKETSDELQSTIKDVQSTFIPEKPTYHAANLSSCLNKLFQETQNVNDVGNVDSTTLNDKSIKYKDKGIKEKDTSNNDLEVNEIKHQNKLGEALDKLETDGKSDEIHKDSSQTNRVSILKLKALSIPDKIPEWQENVILYQIPLYMAYINKFGSLNGTGVSNETFNQIKDQYQNDGDAKHENQGPTNNCHAEDSFVYISDRIELTDVQWQTAEQLLQLSSELALARRDLVPTSIYPKDETFFGTYFLTIQKCLESSNEVWRKEFASEYECARESIENKQREETESTVNKNQESPEKKVETSRNTTNIANSITSTIAKGSHSSGAAKSQIEKSKNSPAVSEKDIIIQINQELLRIKDDATIFSSRLQYMRDRELNAEETKQIEALAEKAIQNKETLQDLLYKAENNDFQADSIKIKSLLLQVNEILNTYEIYQQDANDDMNEEEDRAMPWD